MSRILKTSPDGQLRLRSLKGDKGVVELKVAEDRWVWCVWRSTTIENATRCFDSQVKFHQEERV